MHGNQKLNGLYHVVSPKKTTSSRASPRWDLSLITWLAKGLQDPLKPCNITQQWMVVSTIMVVENGCFHDNGWWTTPWIFGCFGKHGLFLFFLIFRLFSNCLTVWLINQLWKWKRNRSHRHKPQSNRLFVWLSVCCVIVNSCYYLRFLSMSD